MYGVLIFLIIFEEDWLLVVVKFFLVFVMGYVCMEVCVFMFNNEIRYFFKMVCCFMFEGEFYLVGFGIDIIECKLIEEVLLCEKIFFDELIESVFGVFYVVN